MSQQASSSVAIQVQDHTLASLSDDLCPYCMMPFVRSFPVKMSATLEKGSSITLTCNGSTCGRKIHARCAAKLYQNVKLKDGELFLNVPIGVQQEDTNDTSVVIQTKQAEFMHVPKKIEGGPQLQMGFMPLAQCDLECDWLCDICNLRREASDNGSQHLSMLQNKCLLCNEKIVGSLSKLTECILNDNDRTWCHLSCARWHEEIRIESKKRFLFTDKNTLRQNEDKVINDCYVCDDSSKRELLVKCLDCENYAHPTCLTNAKQLKSLSLFFNQTKGKAGYSCGCLARNKLSAQKRTPSLVDREEHDTSKAVMLEWSLIEFGLDEMQLRALVQTFKNREQNLVCEVCAQVMTVQTNATNLVSTVAVCRTCRIVCHKKCNTAATAGIKDFVCRVCRTGKSEEETCSICHYIGLHLTEKEKQHYVCRKYKGSLQQSIKCLHCPEQSQLQGGVIKCTDEEWDAGVHPICHLTHLKNLDPSNCDLQTKRFDIQIQRCFKHSQRRIQTRSAGPIQQAIPVHDQEPPKNQQQQQTQPSNQKQSQDQPSGSNRPSPQQQEESQQDTMSKNNSNNKKKSTNIFSAANNANLAQAQQNCSLTNVSFQYDKPQYRLIDINPANPMALAAPNHPQSDAIRQQQQLQLNQMMQKPQNYHMAAGPGSGTVAKADSGPIRISSGSPRPEQYQVVDKNDNAPIVLEPETVPLAVQPEIKKALEKLAKGLQQPQAEAPSTVTVSLPSKPKRKMKKKQPAMLEATNSTAMEVDTDGAPVIVQPAVTDVVQPMLSEPNTEMPPSSFTCAPSLISPMVNPLVQPLSSQPRESSSKQPEEIQPVQVEAKEAQAKANTVKSFEVINDAVASEVEVIGQVAQAHEVQSQAAPQTAQEIVSDGLESAMQIDSNCSNAVQITHENIKPVDVEREAEEKIKKNTIEVKEDEDVPAKKQETEPADKESSMSKESRTSKEKELGLQSESHLKGVQPEKIAEAVKKSFESTSKIGWDSKQWTKKSSFNLAQQYKQGESARDKLIFEEQGVLEAKLRTSHKSSQPELFLVRTVVGRKEPSGMFRKGEIGYVDKSHQRQHMEKMREMDRQRLRFGTVGGKKPEGRQQLPIAMQLQRPRPAKAPRTTQQEAAPLKQLEEAQPVEPKKRAQYDSDVDEPEHCDEMSCEENDRLEEEQLTKVEASGKIADLSQNTQPNLAFLRHKEKKREKKAKEKLEKKKKKKLGKRGGHSVVGLKDCRGDSSSDDKKLKKEYLQAQKVLDKDQKLAEQLQQQEFEVDRARPARNQKADEKENAFDWNDIIPYFRRPQHREIDILKLEQDYCCDGSRRGDSFGEESIEKFIEKVLLSRNRKPGSSDLTEEQIDMGLNPDKYLSRPPYYNILVNSCREDNQDFSQIWKFREQDLTSDATSKLLEAAGMLESTKGSPTERTSNEILEAEKRMQQQEQAVAKMEECKSAVAGPPEHASEVDMMINKLENMLDTEQLTRGLLEVYQDDQTMTDSQVEAARKILDDATDTSKLQDSTDLPSLELEEILLIGKRDREAFLEPYNRSYRKALQIFTEKELPYTQIDFEILTLMIMVEDEVSVRHKHYLNKVLLDRYNSYVKELDDFEQLVDKNMSRQNFAVIFDIKKNYLLNIKQDLLCRSTKNPFGILQAEYAINSYNDDNSFYQIEEINKRSARRAEALWVFESLMRHYISATKIKFPVLPPKIWLEELNEYVETGLNIEDMLYDDAEKGCMICFTREAQNFNPIMYCRICNSGVHARCFGDDFIEDIDRVWFCHKCREMKFWYKQQKERNRLQKSNLRNRKEQISFVEKQIAKTKKKLDGIKCFLCQQKEGFMKYQKKINTGQSSNWYHPFCVFMTPSYGWRKLVLMQEVVIQEQFYQSVSKMHEKKEKCEYCEKSEDVNRKLLVKCHQCKFEGKAKAVPKFHPMCAWLNANKFTVSVQPDISNLPAQQFDRHVNTPTFEVNFCKIAFGLQVQIKCHFCVDPELKIKTVRQKRFDAFQMQQYLTERARLPWLYPDDDGENKPYDMSKEEITEEVPQFKEQAPYNLCPVANRQPLDDEIDEEEHKATN